MLRHRFHLCVGAWLTLAATACGSPSTTPKSAADASVPPETCPVGNDESCLRHAVDLYLGTEGLPDEKRAFALFEQLCARVGHESSACVLEGIILVNGKGVGADPTRAQQLFRETCEADNMLGCQLAKLPVPKDREPTVRDVEYATALCDLGTALGCKLAGMGRNEARGMVRLEGSETRGPSMMVSVQGHFAESALAAGLVLVPSPAAVETLRRAVDAHEAPITAVAALRAIDGEHDDRARSIPLPRPSAVERAAVEPIRREPT